MAAQNEVMLSYQSAWTKLSGSCLCGHYNCFSNVCGLWILDSKWIVEYIKYHGMYYVPNTLFSIFKVNRSHFNASHMIFYISVFSPWYSYDYYIIQYKCI